MRTADHLLVHHRAIVAAPGPRARDRTAVGLVCARHHGRAAILLSARDTKAISAVPVDRVAHHVAVVRRRTDQRAQQLLADLRL